MSQDLLYVVYSALLTWVMLLTAAMLRVRGWTPLGFKRSLWNRDDLPEATALSGRADRAARNMVENMVLLLAAMLVARQSGVAAAELSAGAGVFFWARLAYFFVYLAGIPVLRTAIWAVSIAGLCMIVAPAL